MLRVWSLGFRKLLVGDRVGEEGALFMSSLYGSKMSG
jgi:hypothetical protein